jgi:predicted RNase H-like HicB family nuclease
VTEDSLAIDLVDHQILIYWSDEDQAFIAEVPELPGCMAHGASQTEALANVKDAIELWLDTAREFGDKIPESQHWHLVPA